mmetsp:Transcript_5705/g.25363  ORF Transcript_5705/g.25363 Transcript_5705/m.25363 type:complete len:263 (+) Transcript_5705:132-920(+)
MRVLRVDVGDTTGRRAARPGSPSSKKGAVHQQRRREVSPRSSPPPRRAARRQGRGRVQPRPVDVPRRGRRSLRVRRLRPHDGRLLPPEPAHDAGLGRLVPKRGQPLETDGRGGVDRSLRNPADVQARGALGEAAPGRRIQQVLLQRERHHVRGTRERRIARSQPLRGRVPVGRARARRGGRGVRQVHEKVPRRVRTDDLPRGRQGAHGDRVARAVADEHEGIPNRVCDGCPRYGRRPDCGDPGAAGGGDRLGFDRDKSRGGG